MLKSLNKKFLIAVLFIVSIICCAVFAIPNSANLANAEVDNNFRICQKINGEYIDYEGNTLDEKPTLYFLVALPQGSTDVHYYYYESEYPIENINNVVNWSDDFSDNDTIVDNGISYKETTFTPLGDAGYKYNKYIYFKRSYGNTDDYSRSFPIQINLSVSGDDLGFPEDSIQATYISSNGNILEYKGSWINSKLTFKITTKWMQKNSISFDSTSERLFYSIDESSNYAEKEWNPLATNILELEYSLSSSLYFKITNASQTEAAYEQFDYPINIDMREPSFDLISVTQNLQDKEVNYLSGNWTSRDVTFKINANNNCLSNVSYFVKTNLDDDFNSLGSTQFIQTSSIDSIIFKARNEAGVEYYSPEFTVNIDKIRPIVKLDVLTIDPEDETLTIPIERYTEPSENGQIVEYDYAANGSIYFNIYNKDVFGNLVNNTSSLSYYCQIKVDGGEYGSENKITRKIGAGEDMFYQFKDSIEYGISIKKTYKIYIESEAGLQSDAIEFTAILVNDDFDIEVEEVTYSTNANGWANSAIPVYVVVPTDTEPILASDNSVLGYTDPTTKYTFYYSATDIANMSYSSKGEYIKGIEEGKSQYKFMLDASADSKFNIFAKNMAGKKSNNTFTTENKIRIDTQLPEENINIEGMVLTEDAYTAGTHIVVESGEWVNGRILLTLKVKIGISNIFVYELQYVEDENGEPKRDEEGNIIWLNSTSALAQSSVEGDIAIYKKIISLPDSSQVSMTEYIGFRVFTGSGVYRDVEYIANIDTTDISLDKICIVKNEDDEEVWQDVNNNNITLEPASEDFKIKLMPNEEQASHFDYYVKENGEFVNVPDLNDYLEILIPENRKGTLTIEFYLESKSINYLENYKTSGIYYLNIDYNTLNITITYSIEYDGDSAGEWRNGNVNVSISLKTEDEGGTSQELTNAEKQNYKYYYMIIDYKNHTEINEDLINGVWKGGDDIDGSYVNNFYMFRLSEFDNSSFYGYIAFSVCNEAGYRSSSPGFVSNVLRIDNTTPDVKDAININENGSSYYDSVNNEYNYYTNETFTLNAKIFSDKAPIKYYYYVIDDESPFPISNPSDSDLNDWTLLDNEKSFESVDNKCTQYIVLLYAVNTLAVSSGGVLGDYDRYKFFIDTCSLYGSLVYTPSDGWLYNSAIGLPACTWKEKAKFTLKLTEKDETGEYVSTKAKLYYSINNSGEWIQYKDELVSSNSSNEVIFDNTIFPSGVMGTFSFKAVNLAGTEFIYSERLYIAMDEEAPEFEIKLSVNDSEYNGGSTDFNDKTGQWSSTDIKIDLIITKYNASGILFTYQIKYSEEGAEKLTVESKVPNNTSFSSYGLLFDNTLFPNRSGDVVLIIKATNKKVTSIYTIREARMRIDRTKPTFELKGEASSTGQATVSVEIGSNEWTNHSQVEVSKTNPAENASKVTYYVTYEDPTSTNKVQYVWTQGNVLAVYDHTCTITVTATSEAGISYTQKFQVNIDTIPPQIKFMGGLTVAQGEKHFIDLKVVVNEENIFRCEYITKKDEEKGFPLTPSGYIISTSSVDNSTSYDPNAPEGEQEYRGYVRIYVEDLAGNSKEIEFYMLPFELTVNTITLSNDDSNLLESYKVDLDKARIYMESSRIAYFENLIARLEDRINTLEQEIQNYRDYLEGLAQRVSYELKSDYEVMYNYLETYNNYSLYGQGWIQTAITGSKGSKYSAYFDNLQEVYKTLDIQMDQVEAVETATRDLPATNVVEVDDYGDVLKVFDLYNDLSAEQKACFTTTLYTKLLALKKRCEILMLVDETTGIAIDGNLSPGAKIKISEYDSTDEYFINAQSALLGAIPDTEARAVVSINNISLTGAASQTKTGDVKVKLPIPEDWQEYITFSVYKYSIDGTISKIEDSTIAGDGKSIAFESNSLSTFILCAKANISNSTRYDDSFGTLLGLKLDVTMVRNLGIAFAAIFVVMLLVIVITGIRRKKFLNTYNRAYKSSRYRKGIQEIPKGNTMPRTNPLKENERVITPNHPY